MSALSTAGIIATYNQELFIAEAVASLVDQVDELIVVNDCSTDGTAGVLDSLRHPNLHVIHNETQLSVSRSYNRAVDASKADLLLIQGGDDRSLPHRADIQRAMFSDREVRLTYSLPRVIDARGLTLPSSVAGEFLIGGQEIDALNTLFFNSNYVCAPAVAIQRVDYLRHGGFHPGLDLLQDYALWLPLAAEGRFAVVDEPVVEYRKHGTNLSREHAGIDSSKRRRFAAEQDYIRARFLARADRAVLERLALGVGLDARRFPDLEVGDLITLIQLAHPDRTVGRRGFDRLLDISAGANATEHLRRMGIEFRDFSDIAMRVDLENLEGVGRAIAARRSLEHLSDSVHS